MHLKNANVYQTPQNRALLSMQKEKRRKMTPVTYLAPAIGATGKLYSGKFRVAPASSNGQP